MTTNRLFSSENNLIIKSFLILTIILFTSVSFVQTHTIFSGKWTFDKSQSNPGEGGYFMESEEILDITQDANTIILDRTIKRTGSDDISSSEKYSLDGKESIDKNDSRTTKTLAKWSEDKQTLTITTIMTFNSVDYRTDDTYSISNNGKSLTIQSTSKNPTGERKMILVYNKN